MKHTLDETTCESCKHYGTMDPVGMRLCRECLRKHYRGDGSYSRHTGTSVGREAAAFEGRKEPVSPRGE